MKFIFASLLVLGFTSSVFAESIRQYAQAHSGVQKTGINEKVTIRVLPNARSLWSILRPGLAADALIPVTTGAADVLQNLDMNKTYNCVLKNSSPMNDPEGMNIYFVIDLECGQGK